MPLEKYNMNENWYILVAYIIIICMQSIWKRTNFITILVTENLSYIYIGVLLAPAAQQRFTGFNIVVEHYDWTYGEREKKGSIDDDEPTTNENDNDADDDDDDNDDGFNGQLEHWPNQSQWN